jgi:hypothetical protein
MGRDRQEVRMAGERGSIQRMPKSTKSVHPARQSRQRSSVVAKAPGTVLTFDKSVTTRSGRRREPRLLVVCAGSWGNPF